MKPIENVRLIKKIANSFSYTTNVEYDDLFQEASLAYLEALKTYDPTRGKITTHMWTCIHNHLKNYIEEEEKSKCKKHNGELYSIEELEVNIPVACVPFWENLNKEAQEIASIVLSSQKEFIALPPDEAQIQIVKTMLNKGWDWAKIYLGIKNLKLTFTKC